VSANVLDPAPPSASLGRPSPDGREGGRAADRSDRLSPVDLLPKDLSRWSEATLAAAILAIDPPAFGGLRLRAAAGPVRDRLVTAIRAMLPAEMLVRHCPSSVGDERLTGGIDLAATLAGGRPVADRGLLAEAAGGLLLAAMAERLPASRAALVAQAMEGESAFGVLLLDEGAEDDEAPAAQLVERAAFDIDLAGLPAGDALGQYRSPAAVEAARALFPAVAPDGRQVEALCEAADAMGVASLRAPLFALKAARAIAALDGRREIRDADVALAAKLVLLPRATRLPSPEADAAPPPAPEPPPEGDSRQDMETAEADGPLSDRVIAAIAATLPPDLLAMLAMGQRRAGAGGRQGKAGEARRSVCRGRPAGVRPGRPGGGVRLALVDTLRAAAPWQPLRRGVSPGLVAVRASDIRIRRFVEKARTTTVFVVDASGSAALHRLGEAKGAIELMLAECYVRRDEVALIAFRGEKADMLLAPTRSLTRAKRALAVLPGGGGTPLASALDAARLAAAAVAKKGDTPVLVFVTDGKANIGRNGQPGREAAEAEALAAAKALRAEGRAALVIDAAPRPEPKAKRLADAMAATYLALPRADAAGMAKVAGAAKAAAARR
jgi:magnesium chelatase subunit D